MKYLSSLNHFFWKYRVRLILGIVFIILTNYFRILAPQITGYVVNTVVNKTEKNVAKYESNRYKKNDFIVQVIIKKFEKISFSQKIIWSGITLLVLALISGLFMFLMRQTIIVMSRLIEFDQKNQVFNHYQKLDLSFYKANSTGDLMSRISEDVSRVRMYTGPAIMYFINLAAVLGFSIFFMYKASPKLTLIALLPLPLLAIAIYTVNTIINKKSERVQSLLSNLTTNAQESYSGIRVIKSFVQENAMIQYFTTNSKAYKKNALDLAKTEAIYSPSMMLLIGVSTLLTIMVGAMDVLKDPVNNNVGTIAEFVMYIQMMTFPVSAIGWTASMTQRAAASQKRLNEFLETTPNISNAENAKSISLTGDIDFENVNFKYENTGIQALKNLSLSIKSGEKVAIIGKTGSGKTTLFQLLLRMYDATSGKIKYDNNDITQLKLEDVRSQIAYVPQDVFLFSDTVTNNIRFGKSEIGNDDIAHAAMQACIHNEILQFKNQYETLIGERGVTLSGGQKQRISIARALLKSSKILLLDDSLSAVDATTEQQIIENLSNFLKNRTTIVISHRIFTSMKFDKIVVLSEGSIAEQGTHEMLLEKKGVYFEIFHAQEKTKVDI